MKGRLRWVAVLTLTGCRPDPVTTPDPPDDSDPVVEDSGGPTETIPSTTEPWLRDEREAPGSIAFSELHYHPALDPGLEWVELHNPMVLDMDLSGWALAGALSFRFDEGVVLPAGGYLVVAQDPSLLAEETGYGEALGPWEGKLANDGERLELFNNGGRLIDTVGYDDDDPWPVGADGSGFTLAKMDPEAASDRAEHWTVSAEPGGTPGASNLLDPLLPPVTRELLPEDATWAYDLSGDYPAEDWADPGYDDSAWDRGQALFWAGEVPDETEAVAWATADNYFSLYLGQADGSELRLVGEDSDGSWTTVEGFELLLGPLDHLFIAAWELSGDSGSPQMTIAELELPDAIVGTDSEGFEWVLGPVGDNPGALPAQAPPSEEAIATLIAEADAGGAWELPGAEADRSSSPWGGSVGSWFGDAAHFIWADGFDADSITNQEDTYALFRSVAPLVAPQGALELDEIPTTITFRGAFDFHDDPASTELSLTCTLDDGAVIRLNGVEVHRENMPEGEVDAQTLAAEPVDEAAQIRVEISSEALVRGPNLLAVELHQASHEDEDMAFGCSLDAETWPSSVPPTVLLNEVAPAGEGGFWVELLDVSGAGQHSTGLLLRSSAGEEAALPDGEIEPGGLLLLELPGFSVQRGDAIFLGTPDGSALLDAVRIGEAPRAREEDGGPWRSVREATPGEPNRIERIDDVVIHEIQYHRAPLAEQDQPVVDRTEEWIELYNRGEQEVDLSGWQLVDAVAYRFPTGTRLAPDGFLVIANDAEALAAEHPEIEVLGDFSGRLGNDGERILLLDALGNPADEVRYHDGGRWPSAADGGGSSLELRDPWADNSAPEAWAASDESARAGWDWYHYRGLAEPSAVGPDGVWEELVLGLLDEGEVLIDDLSVTRDPDGEAVELLQEGGFDAGGETWRLLGNHRHSAVVPDPDDPSNAVLHLVATGPTEHMHNHVETTLLEPIQALEYEISFRARWVQGSHQLNTRLYFDRLPRTTLVEQPEGSGTPGRANASAEDNIGPTFAGLTQDAAVPQPWEPVLISVEVDDPDGVRAVSLWSSVDGAPASEQAMVEAAPGRWRAEIEGQAAGSIVQIWVEAEDELGARASFPAEGADSRALIGFDDDQTGGDGLHELRILMTPEDADWLHEDVNLMSNDRVGATVVYRGAQVFYDAGVRLKGSQRGRPTTPRLGYALSFHDDQPFRGSHGSVLIDRSEGVGFGQRELLLNLVMTRAGAVHGEYNDLIHLVAPRSDYTGSAELQLDRFSNLVLASQFDDGDDGTRFEYELIYYPTTTEDGSDEGLKLPQPDSVVGTALTDLGEDKEAYRWLFQIKNNEREDDYTSIIQLCQLMGLPSAELNELAPALIDVDQWLRAFAFATLSGATDQYGGAGSQHNAQFYQRPEDGRMLYFPHDLDFFSSSSMGVVNNSDLAQLIEDPLHERIYYGHLEDIIAQAYNTEYLGPWCEQLGALLPAQDFDSHCAFIDDRANWVLYDSPDAVMTRYPSVDFSITTGGGGELEVAQAEITLEGEGWIDVHSIARDDQPLEIQWLDGSTWQVTVPLEPGPNTVTLVASDGQGEVVGADTVLVTSTAGR